MTLDENAPNRLVGFVTDEVEAKFKKKMIELNLSRSALVGEAVIRMLDADLLLDKTLEGLDVQIEQLVANLKVLLMKKESLVRQRAQEVEEARKRLIREQKASEIRKKIESMDKRNLDEQKLNGILQEIAELAKETETKWSEIDDLVGKKHITSASLNYSNFKPLDFTKKKEE